MKKRSYNQTCSLARALDLIGERWTLLLVRELLIGPRRFKDLLEGLSGIGTNLLASRLKKMEGEGLIERATLPAPAGSAVYRLTDFGKKLEPTVFELIRWGLTLPSPKKKGELSRPEWDLVAMKATFNPGKARGVRECYELNLDGTAFHFFVKDGTLEARPGNAPNPDVIVLTDRNTLSALGQRKLSLNQAVKNGKLQIEGNKKAASRMLDIFIPGKG